MQGHGCYLNPSVNLVKTLQRIKEYFFKGSLELLAKQSKHISPILIYFFKCSKFMLKKDDCLDETLEQCAYFISCIVESSQWKKYGHIFPTLGFLGNKAIFFAKGLKNSEHNQNILNRILKNESSPIYRTISKLQISAKELNFIQQRKIQKLVESVQSKEISLLMRECICCSTIFVKDCQIHNSNPIFSTVLTLNSLNFEDLQKLLSSIANQNGGVIIIGAKKIGKKLQAVGLKFSLNTEIQKAQLEIKHTIRKLKPHFMSLVERVQVHRSFLEEKDKEPISFCFRVRIFPQQHNKLSYLELTSKNHSPFYQIYKLDQNKNSTLVKPKEAEKGIESPYTIMHKKYYQKNHQKPNTHKGILCYPPIKSSYNFLQMDKKKFIDSPQFKYPNTTLFIVNSTKQDRHAIEFHEDLEGKKNLVQLSKPFSQSFKCNPGDRSVWMFSHQMSFKILREKLINYQQNSGEVFPEIKMLPVETHLQIEKSKFSDFNQKLMHKKFTQRYPQDYAIEIKEAADKNKQKVNLVFLTFSDFEQAIYAYMIMEELNLKPYFTKPGKVYTK